MEVHLQKSCTECGAYQQQSMDTNYFMQYVNVRQVLELAEKEDARRNQRNGIISGHG